MRVRERRPAPGALPRGVARARVVVALGFVLVGTPVALLVLLPLRDELALGSVLLLYLLGVVAVSVTGGLGPGLASAAVSFTLANLYFTPPFGTLKVAGRDEVIELAVFAATALVVASAVEFAARDRQRFQHALDSQGAAFRELAAEDRARATLLAAVGHDLRTPLTGIKAAVSALRQEDVPWSIEAQQELLATIEESTDRLTGLVANLLDTSRLRAGAVTVHLEVVDLEEVALAAVRGDRRVTVRAEDPPLAVADVGLLDRVVFNLVDNALRFGPHGTLVEVVVRSPEGPEGPEGSVGSRTVDLCVVDHGPGIPPERRAEVFTAFQRLDDRGTGSHLGLGLAIAKGFTEAMGGELLADATPGGGLTMTVRLRAAGT